MHLTCSNLHLDPLSVAARYGGVNRTIAVAFWLANIILETARNSAPTLMNDPKCSITIRLIFANRSKSINIRESRERNVLLFHLAPNGIRFLCSARYFSMDICLFQLQQHIRF